MRNDPMPRENLWMDSGTRAEAVFIHRFQPVPRDFITSPDLRQRLVVKDIGELFTKRAVSY
jgi:hypothetical protein